MGNIRLRGCVWYIDYRCRGRRFKERVGQSKSLAKEVLAKREAEIAEGRFFPNRRRGDLSFADMANLYWEEYGKHKRGAYSGKYYIAALVEALGDKPLNAVTVLDLQGFLNRIKDSRCAATANRYHAVVRSIFNRAIQWDKYDTANPAARVRPFPVINQRLRYLSREEMVRLAQCCDPRIRPIVLCALMTGMRRGEILDLAWDDVDLEHGLLYVVKSKSGKSREIPIVGSLYRLFQELGPKRAGKVFDVPIITLRRWFSRALEKAGIRGFRFHDLRHTFASHFIMRTNDLPALQRILGHYSPVMTQRYAHLSMDHLRAGMEQFESGLVPKWSQTAKLPGAATQKVVVQ